MTYKSAFKAKHNLFFDGAADKLESDPGTGTGLSNLNPEYTDSFSITAWVYLSRDYHMPILSRDSGANSVKSWALGIEQGGPRVVYRMIGTTYASTLTVMKNNVNLPLQRWIQVGFVYDADTAGFTPGTDTTDNACRLYTSGIPEERVNQYGSGNNLNSALAQTDGTSRIKVGYSNYGYHYIGQWFDGTMSNLAFWGQALSDDQMAEVYYGRNGDVGPGDLRKHSAQSSLVSWWIGSASDSTSTIYDQIGSHDLTATSITSSNFVKAGP